MPIEASLDETGAPGLASSDSPSRRHAGSMSSAYSASHLAKSCERDQQTLSRVIAGFLSAGSPSLAALGATVVICISWTLFSTATLRQVVLQCG